MRIPIETAVKSIEGLFFDFARTHIQCLPGLGGQTVFPEALWEQMGQAGLLNPALFTAPGLEGRSCLAITRAGSALVSGGGNLGMALSWMVHHLVARYLLPQEGNNAHPSVPEQLHRAMASGAATVCFAVSEPKAGAHPKYMAATARKITTGYLVNGEKTYLTNGPIAQAFVVIAVTGVERGQKQFSAFLVPQKTQGLRILPPMEIPFFNPSPHGSICLEDCQVTDNALLGRLGHAHKEMVIPFRKCEDAAMTGPVIGAMGFLLAALAREMARGGKTAEPEIEQLGGLAALLKTADLLSGNLARTVDDSAFLLDPEAILLQFKDLVGQYTAELDTLVKKTDLVLPGPCEFLIHDLNASAQMGKTSARIQRAKLGRVLLAKSGNN
jgi:acyl-CoA dehydrogenase